MSARPLVPEDDPVLRAKATPVIYFGDPLPGLVADLFETMYAENGRGLAAPQVGVSERVFVIDTGWKEGDKHPIAFVNPEIIDQAPFKQLGEEACLSLPGRRFQVPRPIWVDLAWTSPAGIRQNQRFQGITAICICHELDHLNGILITESGTEV